MLVRAEEGEGAHTTSLAVRFSRGGSPANAALLQELKDSPRLPEIVRELEAVVEDERRRRGQFLETVRDDQKAEFINGEVILHSPAKLRHLRVSSNIVFHLEQHVRAHALGIVLVEKALVSLTRNDYEPDISFVAKARATAFAPDQMQFPAPDLVVELLSPSTSKHDRGIKHVDYAAHGVTEYWIVDAETETIEQYVLEGERYALAAKVKIGVIVRQCGRSGLAVRRARRVRPGLTRGDFLRELGRSASETAGRHRCSTRMRILSTLVVALALSAHSIHAQDPPAEPWSATLANVQIPMRDGKSLAANIHLPTTPGKYPCVLVQTPYDKDRMGRETGDAPVGEAARGSEHAWRRFDKDHYAYAFVDWRGFFASKAAMEGVDRRSWKRGQDGYDAVEWIAKQPWCDGKVGTWGGSALGKQQFDTATEQPPHLVCAAPLIAFQGTRYSTYYEGGVQIESMVKGHDRLGFGVGEFVNGNRLPSRLWDFARTRSYHPEKVAVPCLMVSGWWDNFPRDVLEQFADLMAKGQGAAKESKLVMGPWSHTAIDLAHQGDLDYADAADYSTAITLEFFDHYLRGTRDPGWTMRPRVHAYQCGEGWVTAESWGALAGKPRTMHLHADGRIAVEPPAAGAEAPATRSVTYDPRDPSPTIGGQNLPPLSHGPRDVAALEARKDVLVYTTGPLAQPLRMRGVLELVVGLACDRVDCDLHVRVSDDDGTGKSYLVGETTQRAKLRDGRTVQLLEPGKVYELVLRLPPHAYTWRAGHALKLILTGCSSPRYERNPHTGTDAWDAASALTATITLHHGGARLVVPEVGD